MGAVQLRGELRHHLEQVGDQAVVGDLEDRRLLVLVDGDDDLAVLHPRQVLDGARDADRDVELGRHDLAGLPDLVVVRRIARVHRGARGADRGAELVRHRLDQVEVLGRAHGRPPEIRRGPPSAPAARSWRSRRRRRRRRPGHPLPARPRPGRCRPRPAPGRRRRRARSSPSCRRRSSRWPARCRRRCSGGRCPAPSTRRSRSGSARRAAPRRAAGRSCPRRCPGRAGGCSSAPATPAARRRVPPGHAHRPGRSPSAPWSRPAAWMPPRRLRCPAPAHGRRSRSCRRRPPRSASAG